MKHFLSIVLAASVFCALASPQKEPANAENEEFMDSIFSIKEVSVIETKNKEIIKPQSFSGADLERLNSQSVADALRYFSGVQIKDYGGIGGIKTINVRSMGSAHVGVFYNGVQLGNAQNGQVDLGRYSLDNVEAITLYNGQKSDIFQSAKDFGSATAIYIATKRPKFRSSEWYHLTVQMKTGSFGLANPSFVWEQKLSSRVHLSLNAEYTYANGRYKFRYRQRNPKTNVVAFDTTAVRQNGDVEALRTEFGLYGYIPDGKWNVNGYFYTSERGLPGAIVANVFKRSERQWDKAAFGQASFSKKAADFYEFKVNGKYAWDYTRFYRFDEKELFVDNRYYQRELYLSMANLFRITDWWEASAATDWQWNALNANLLGGFAYPSRFTELVSVATSVHLGGFNAQASMLATFVQEKSRANPPHGVSPDKSELTPALFVSYKPFQRRDFSVYGFYKEIFRMPTFNDLYYTFLGNVNLLPETTYQYDIGSSYGKAFKHSFFNFVNFKADLYYNRVKNKIIASPSGPMFRWKMENLGLVKIFGAEFSGDIGFHIGRVDMKTHLQYTYQDARDRTNPEDPNYGDQIPYIPWHSFSITYNANWKGWDFNYSFTYAGERYNEVENIRNNYVSPWYLHDISMSKEFRIDRCRLKVSGEINNLLAMDYSIVLGYPMPRRNFKIALKLMF